MIVSSPFFQAYLECPTKCWLRFYAEPATGNIYAEWTRAQDDSYRLPHQSIKARQLATTVYLRHGKGKRQRLLLEQDG